MKTLLLFAHSYFESSKANKALLEEAKKLESVQIHSLNELYKDYQIDIAKEQKLLGEAEKIILQFPLFWYSTPAILKHWQDEVLTPIYNERLSVLKDKKLGFIITTGEDKEGFAELDLQGQSGIERVLFPLNLSFESVGAKVQKPLIIFEASEKNLPFDEYTAYLKA